jgi:hypothetical protein
MLPANCCPLQRHKIELKRHITDAYIFPAFPPVHNAGAMEIRRFAIVLMLIWPNKILRSCWWAGGGLLLGLLVSPFLPIQPLYALYLENNT